MLEASFFITLTWIVILSVTFGVGIVEEESKSVLIFVLCLILSLVFVATSIAHNL